MNIKYKPILLIIILVFFVIGSIFLYKAYDKYTNYFNSEKYMSLNVNAYVGGDAYNYIINGTYFTGFSVLGIGFYIISAIFSIPLFFMQNQIKPESSDLNELHGRIKKDQNSSKPKVADEKVVEEIKIPEEEFEEEY